MDDVALLRRTVRRCTAVLVAALGVATWALADFGTARTGLLLAVGALLYLAGSLVFAPEPDRARDGSADRSESGT